MKNILLLGMLCVLILGIVAYALPTETFVSPTQDDNAYVSQDWIYVNLTSDENLNTSIIELTNITDVATNHTMTNSSLTNWYLNVSGEGDGIYNYTVWMENSSGDWNETIIMVITLDTINPVVAINGITDAQVTQSILGPNGTCTDTNVDCAYTNSTAFNTTDTSGAIFNFTNTGTTMTTAKYDILVTCNDSAGNTGTDSAYYYYVGTDHYMVLGEDYDNALLFNIDQTSVYTSVPIEINGTEISTSMYNHTINTTQDWTNLNINFTPIIIGTGHNAFLYIEGSGEVKHIDDSEFCTSVGTNKIKCIGTEINVDSTGTNKFISYTNDIALSTPTDSFINDSTNDTQGFIFTNTQTFNTSLSCNLYVDDTIVYTDSTVDDSTATTLYSNTSLTNTSHTWYIECGGRNSSVRTLWIDNVAPVIDTYGYENISSGALELKYTVTENDTDSTCTFYIYNNDTIDTITGAWNQTTGRIRDCVYNLTASDITYEGYFTIGSIITDSIGNSLTGTNQTNFTNLKLYSGWTAVQVDRNQTMKNLSAMHTGITRVSWYNNTGKSFINYVVGLTTNADTQMYDGDTAFVQVSTDTSLLRKLTHDYGEFRNVTYTLGWNGASAWNITTYLNLEQICDEAIDNSSAALTHVAWWESVEQKYTAHVCDFAFNNETQVPLGQGYFVRSVNTTTQGRYR